jgi:hypothetical protein
MTQKTATWLFLVSFVFADPSGLGKPARYRAIHAVHKGSEDELIFGRDEIILVTAQPSHGWWHGYRETDSSKKSGKLYRGFLTDNVESCDAWATGPAARPASDNVAPVKSAVEVPGDVKDAVATATRPNSFRYIATHTVKEGTFDELTFQKDDIIIATRGPAGTGGWWYGYREEDAEALAASKAGEAAGQLHMTDRKFFKGFVQKCISTTMCPTLKRSHQSSSVSTTDQQNFAREAGTEFYRQQQYTGSSEGMPELQVAGTCRTEYDGTYTVDPVVPWLNNRPHYKKSRGPTGYVIDAAKSSHLYWAEHSNGSPRWRFDNDFDLQSPDNYHARHESTAHFPPAGRRSWWGFCGSWATAEIEISITKQNLVPNAAEIPDEDEHRRQISKTLSSGTPEGIGGAGNGPLPSIGTAKTIYDRRRWVKKVFTHAYVDGYRRHAWGHDTLKPVSKHFLDDRGQLGCTIIDALDSLWLMGLDDASFQMEFNDAAEFVRARLSFDRPDVTVNVFETSIRVLGGLLSAYHLSNQPIFLSQAVVLGSKLSSTFKSSSGVPLSDLKLHEGVSFNP